MARALGRHWTAILTFILASFYVFLGATALGVAGIAGILGGLLVVWLIAGWRRPPQAMSRVLLALVAIPFAALTWSSVATPLIGILLIAFGWLALTRARTNRRGSQPAPLRLGF